jgi:predicted NBD/HSP70 family sugar kinase
MSIRVVDGGGDGFRRADVDGIIPSNFAKTHRKPESVREVVDFVYQDLPAGTQAVGFSLAGVIRNSDLIVNSPNLPFLNGVRLATAVAKAGALKKAAVFNDMEAAVTGMAALVPDAPYFLGITWSSGIGLRVWSGGKLLSVAEGGHMMLDESPFAPVCGCGRRGHVEAIVAGKAIRRRVLAECEARSIAVTDAEPSRFLIQAWKREEPWAVEIKHMIAHGMGMFLANVQSLLNLPLIVWKGTFALNALKDLEPLMREEMKGVLIDPTWADKKNLAFKISPGADPKGAPAKALTEKFAPGRDCNLDALIGAAYCLQAFAR